MQVAQNRSKGKALLGFTLIELMIAVVIVGILAAVAVPSMVRYIADAKMSEARSNILGILESEQAYFAIQHRYASANQLCPPNPAPTGDTQLWPADIATQCGAGWEDLGWHPNGGLYFQYRIFSNWDGADGDPRNTLLNPTRWGVDWESAGWNDANPNPPLHWCAVEAIADTDAQDSNGDGDPLVYLRGNIINLRVFREAEDEW